MGLERSVAEGRKCLPEERENDATEIILYVFFFVVGPYG